MRNFREITSPYSKCMQFSYSFEQNASIAGMQHGLFGGWLSSVCQKKMVGTTKSSRSTHQGTVHLTQQKQLLFSMILDPQKPLSV